jgi:acyl carrier protein
MEMVETSVRERVRAIVLEMAPLLGTAAERASLMRADLGYDSLALLELADALDHEFGMAAADEDDGDVETVSDVEALVLAKLERAGRLTR